MDRAAEMEVKESIAKQNDAVLKLAKHVISTVARESNLVFSPSSITVVLGIIAAGSDDETRDQILSFLLSPSTDKLNAVSSKIVSFVFADGTARNGPRVSAVNGVWYDKTVPVKPPFKELLESSYKAVFNHVDFRTKAGEVLAEVNSWAEEKTNGLIKKLLPPSSVNSMTDIVFANALYFKGKWCEPFTASLTKDDDFHLLDGTSVRVPFMTTGSLLYLEAYDGYRVMTFSYQNGGGDSSDSDDEEEDDDRYFSMNFYLPDKKDGLPTLVEKICSVPGFLDSDIPHQRVKVDKLKIPKFKFSFGFDASEVLQRFGVSSPSIFHKSFIDVNEWGTEVASATAVSYIGSSMPPPEKLDFVADHPFLFLLRERVTGAVMFIGQVLDPSQP